MSTRVRASSLSSTATASSSGSKRPRLTSQNKRVSFDATSIPLPSATWEELASPSVATRSFTFPTEGASSPSRDIYRAAEIDSTVDLKAVLAAGIMQWRSEVDEAAPEGSS